jgi:hypothetical protein
VSRVPFCRSCELFPELLLEASGPDAGWSISALQNSSKLLIFLSKDCLRGGKEFERPSFPNFRPNSCILLQVVQDGRVFLRIMAFFFFFFTTHF